MSPSLGGLVQGVQPWLLPVQRLQSHFWMLFLSQLPLEGELGLANVTSGGTSSPAPLGSHSPAPPQGFRALGGSGAAQGAGSGGVTHAGNRSDPD